MNLWKTYQISLPTIFLLTVSLYGLLTCGKTKKTAGHILHASGSLSAGHLLFSEEGAYYSWSHLRQQLGVDLLYNADPSLCFL